MIHYHGTPITPTSAAAEVLAGRHAFVSFAAQQNMWVVADVCQSFAIDNGAFSAWTAGAVVDWAEYYKWVASWLHHPSFDFAIIPDEIEGDERANDALLQQWPFGIAGVPVWHMHESVERFSALAGTWPRVAIGSSGKYVRIGTARWWSRISEALEAVCDGGFPRCKLHGLRMLDPQVFNRIPFASADSTNVARNIGMDSRWNGTYQPPDKATRAVVLARRIEAFQAAQRWEGMPVQQELIA
jgi:hypothetical protein